MQEGPVVVMACACCGLHAKSTAAAATSSRAFCRRAAIRAAARSCLSWGQLFGDAWLLQNGKVQSTGRLRGLKGRVPPQRRWALAPLVLAPIQFGSQTHQGTSQIDHHADARALQVDLERPRPTVRQASCTAPCCRRYLGAVHWMQIKEHLSSHCACLKAWPAQPHRHLPPTNVCSTRLSWPGGPLSTTKSASLPAATCPRSSRPAAATPAAVCAASACATLIASSGTQAAALLPGARRCTAACSVPAGARQG